MARLGIISERLSTGTARGIGWMLVTGFCFAGVTGIVRYLGSDLPSVEAAFLRFLAAADQGVVCIDDPRGELRRAAAPEPGEQQRQQAARNTRLILR